MAFDIDVFLKESGSGVVENESQTKKPQSVQPKETAFDIDTFLKENVSQKSISSPEPSQFFSIEDTVSSLGEAFSGLTKTVPASYYAAKEGLARPDQYSKESIAAFDAQREYFKQKEKEAATRGAEGRMTSVGEAIRGAGQSLGFTVTGMAPAIAGGAMAGAAAGALFPPSEAATIPIGAIAGGIGSMVASAPVSYRMAGGQFLYDAFKSLEENKGSPLTEEEKTKAYNELLPIAQNTALWEAGPEAIGNAVELGALKYAFGFGKKAATTAAGKAIEAANNTILKKVGAVAGSQAIELAGETATQMQQGPDQAKMEQYIQTGSTAGSPDEYQGISGAVKAFKEVAPSTLALGAMTAGAGGVVKVAGMGGKEIGKVFTSTPKTPEQIEENQINDAANKAANDLSISPDDTEANNLNQRIKALSQVQEIRKQTLAAIEPTSREAQTLKLDIAEGETMLSELNQNLTKLTGLSLPITEAEKQQIELAKQIAAPEVAPAPTEVTPTEVAVAEAATPVVEGLQAVSENTATPEQLTQLSESGLVDIVQGEPVINEEGQAVLTQAEAPLPVLTPEERRAEIEAAPVAETPAITEAPAAEVAPTIEPLTDDQAETIRDVITLRKSQGREPNPEQVKRLAEYDARKAGVDVQEGDIISNIVVGHPMFEAPQPELSNLVPIKVQNKEQLASPIQRTQQVRDAAQSYIGQYQVEQAKAKTPAQKKAFAKKFNKSELDRQRDILDYIKNDVMPELDRLEKTAPSATPAVSETITKPKLGEKGGVLIPSREDFIQAGRNIYEKGMEFGAWAKQMIQQFGDAVREFLGDVWQAVSGAPAKLNELMGYLPGKGEAGAVSLGRGEKQPAKATEPEAEKPTPKREQVMGEKIGALKKTPEGIIAETQAKLRERFDPTKVTEQNTTEAFRSLGRLTGKDGTAFAQELNDIGRVVDESGAASEISMGAALFVNDLFEYAVRLAADGQKMMLGIMMTNINKLPAAGIGRSDAGRQLRAAKEMKTTFLTMAQAEQDAFVNYAAEFVYGPNPTQEQIDSIKIGYDAVEKVEEPTAEEVEEEIKSVGEKSGTNLVDKIKEEIDKAVAPENKDPMVAAITAMLKMGGTFVYTKTKNKIKAAVENTIKGGITNYRKKLVEGAASGLETGFWKTLSDKENKPGPLGELDNAQNRELGSIVKNTLISLGLKGTPPNTKMSIYEQVASILGEKPLSQDKIKSADEKIRQEIERKRQSDLESTEDEDAQNAINLKYDKIELAWDEAMSRQLDMPVSGSMLRRLIYNDLKEAKTSIKELAALMNEEPVIGARRQESLVNSVIQKIAGITFEGQNPANYSSLKEYLGNQLELMIVSEQTKALTAKAKAQITKDAKSSIELQAEKAENEAQNQIDRLAKIQSDTPSFPPEAEMNPVREAVKNALKLSFNLLYDPRNEPDAINNLKKNLALQLQSLGVKEGPATILASVVARQVEINSLNNKFKAIDRAVEKGPISEIVNAVKNTPLEEQQKPNWRYNVMLNYLRKAGLHIAQAERIAKLMDISLQKRFVQGKEQAFTDAISKTAPWKSGNVRSKRAFQQVIQAIRAGALDPSRNMVSDIAAMNGWTGFTADQYKVLLKNDAILADPKSGELQKSEAYKAIQDIISKSKLPIRARDVIGQYYDAQALNGIPTFSVNAFSPIAFAMRNLIVEIGSGTLKGNPKAITNATTAFVDSIKSWANTVAFSFKNNVTVYSNVDYIVNDDNLLRLYRKGVDQFTKGKTPRDRADGVKNMMIGMMDYVRRALNALDYGAIAGLQNQNISKYAMAVMKRQKMTDKQANEMFGVMMKAKNDFYVQQIADGMDKNRASILADEFYISSWSEALSKAGVEKSDINQAMNAAINDALSSVGRNRQSIDALKGEATKLKDAGVSSMPALWLLESMANAANQSENQVLKLFSRVIYGFAIVPARVIRDTAWFSPYGFVRFGYDYAAKKMGKTSPYAQSLGTDLQYSQRLNEAIAGTVALTALFALRAGSTDDPEDEDAFKIVFTGNGPQRKDDPQFYDSWYKAGNKPNTMSVYFGKSKFDLNMMRGFEAFTWPAMMLGALDDLEIRKKQNKKTNTSSQLEDASIVAGFVFDAALRRGPYAFTTKSLFGTYGDIGVEGVAKGLTFPAKTLIPVLGTSLASNLSNFMNDPIDRRTLDGAVWSNIPFIGPAVAPKSLNAFGEPALSNDMASKMFKLGVPIVFDIPTDRESIKLHELVLKQGGGPSIPTRNQLAQRLDRQPTNKEYEMFVKEYGASLTKSMKSSYNYLMNAKPERYSKQVEKIGLRARDTAERKVRMAARNP